MTRRTHPKILSGASVSFLIGPTKWTQRICSEKYIRIQCLPTKSNRLMLFRETVAAYCENHAEHTNTLCTSQETHYVTATNTNRSMLFRETVAAYCENHAEHTNTLCTSQETHYVTATNTNRLMLFRETVAVCCENHMEHTN
jgi:hypothetical protein